MREKDLVKEQKVDRMKYPKKDRKIKLMDKDTERGDAERGRDGERERAHFPMGILPPFHP